MEAPETTDTRRCKTPWGSAVARSAMDRRTLAGTMSLPRTCTPTIVNQAINHLHAFRP